MEVVEVERNKDDEESAIVAALKTFIPIKNSIYLNQSDKNLIICKDSKSMKCDCTVSERQKLNGELSCTSNCINRLLYIECSQDCPTGKYCSNNHFQRYYSFKLS